MDNANVPVLEDLKSAIETMKRVAEDARQIIESSERAENASDAFWRMIGEMGEVIAWHEQSRLHIQRFLQPTNKPASPGYLREQLADLCHRQWAGWMRYLFSKGTFNEDGTWTMPAWAVERWQRQMNTPYSELPEAEQDSDKKEADKFLKVIDAA